MRALLSLTLAGIVSGLFGPARAEPGRADAHGAVVRCLPRPHVGIEVTGTLRMQVHGLEDFALNRPHLPERPPLIQVWWEVTVNGQTYRVEIGERKDFHELAGKLNGRVAVVSGELTGRTIRVTGLRAADASARPGAHVRIEGTLNHYELTSLPPVEVWEAAVNGTSYRLKISAPALRARAEKLAGRLVWVSGELQGGRVVVTDLVAVPPLRC